MHRLSVVARQTVESLELGVLADRVHRDCFVLSPTTGSYHPRGISWVPLFSFSLGLLFRTLLLAKSQSCVGPCLLNETLQEGARRNQISPLDWVQALGSTSTISCSHIRLVSSNPHGN